MSDDRDLGANLRVRRLVGRDPCRRSLSGLWTDPSQTRFPGERKHPDVDPTVLEAMNLTSFKHVCHRCGSATWWNPIAVLSGLFEREEQ